MAILLPCFANFLIWSLAKWSLRRTLEPWALHKNWTCICLLNNLAIAHRVINCCYCHVDREINSFFFSLKRNGHFVRRFTFNCLRWRNPIQLFGNRLCDASLNKTFCKLGSCFLNKIKCDFFFLLVFSVRRMLRGRQVLDTKGTLSVSLNIETCLLNSCVIKYTCSLRSSDTNNKRSKGPIHNPVFPSLAVDTLTLLPK